MPIRRAMIFSLLVAMLVIAASVSLPARAQQLYEDFIIDVTNDRADEVKALLARGMDPNTVTATGEPVLVIAVRNGNAATVDALLATKDLNVNARNKSGDDAIMTAAISGRLDLVKKLRAHGAKIDGPGWTPLIYAATGGHDDMIVYLLGEGAKIDAVSPNGTSALMMAIRENKPSTAELLIARGINVNLRNENGASALDWAKRNNDTAMVAKLKSAGARE